MNNDKKVILISKIFVMLLIISVIFLSIKDLKQNKDIINQTNDTIKIDDNNNEKEISSTENSSNSNNSTNSESKNITDNQNTQKPSSSSTKTNQSSQSSQPKEKSLKEKNAEIIKEIKSIYGYDVSYGQEEFWYGGTASTKLTDESKANTALTELKNKSAIFPPGFFRTFQGYNGFRVLLFENINGAAGVASYEFGDDNLIALNVSGDFLGRVFYHEVFHIIDQYISYRTYGTTNPFDDWNKYNPSGFNYDYYNDSFDNTIYDFDSYNNPESIAFVSKYAKTSAREDRAELFADLMFRGIKKEYMNKNFAVNKKAKSMALTLRNFFSNSTGAKWETFIDWS